MLSVRHLGIMANNSIYSSTLFAISGHEPKNNYARTYITVYYILHICNYVYTFFIHVYVLGIICKTKQGLPYTT